MSEFSLQYWCARCGFYRVGERGEPCVICRSREMSGREAMALRSSPLGLAQEATFTPVSKPYERNGETAAAALSKTKWPYIC